MNRKDEHLSLAKAFHKDRFNDFDNVRIVHHSFPETNLTNISIATELLENTFATPFFINAMTGGSEKTKDINRQLAQVAKECNLMLATGSISAALKDPSLAHTFTIVRETYPEGFILANVGAGTSAENAKRAVNLLQANALQVHLNAPQELVMPEGDRLFDHWLSSIEEIVKTAEVPVLIKEVGFGMSRETIRQLLDTGIKTIDVSGSGGTSFTQIENARRKKREMSYLKDYGQSTVISLLEANEVPHPFERVASGGIRNAFDIFKSLCLGAKSVGISASILTILLSKGPEAAIEKIQNWQEELHLLYGITGKTNTKDLKKVPLVFSGDVKDWCEARHIPLVKYSMR